MTENKAENKKESVPDQEVARELVVKQFKKSRLLIVGSLKVLVEEANKSLLSIKEVLLINGSFSAICEELGEELEGTFLKVTQKADQFSSVNEINLYEGSIEKMIVLAGNGKAFISRHNIARHQEIEEEVTKEEEKARVAKERQEKKAKLEAIEEEEKALAQRKKELK
jgi:exosome complex RNA-binding protein Rrp4